MLFFAVSQDDHRLTAFGVDGQPLYQHLDHEFPDSDETKVL
jgi:hypothetical protein